MTIRKGVIADVIIHTSAIFSGGTQLDWEDFSFEHDNKIKEIYTGGKRNVEENCETVIGLKFSLSQPYQNYTGLATPANVGAVTALTTYYIGIFPQGYELTKPCYSLTVKVGKYTMNCKADGALQESVDCWVSAATYTASYSE